MDLEIPVIGILRGIESSFFQEVMSASFSLGLQAIEVTMNTRDAEKIISQYRSSVPNGKLLGVGTITNIKKAKVAVSAGAMFLVTPNCDPEVIEYTRKENIPIIAGAMTPTEVYKAWSIGADMVKVFPCNALGGSSYIRDLKGPLDEIPLVAVGGITIENLADYFDAGASGVGASTALFGKKALEQKNLGKIEKNVASFVNKILEIKKCTDQK